MFYNQALADLWSTGAGIKFLYCMSASSMAIGGSTIPPYKPKLRMFGETDWEGGMCGFPYKVCELNIKCIPNHKHIASSMLRIMLGHPGSG